MDFRSANCIFTTFCLFLFFSTFFLFYGNMFNRGGIVRTHEQNRGLICAACGCKDLKGLIVTDSLEVAIKEEIFKDYDRRNNYYPNGVCNTCRTNLFKAKKGGVVPTALRDRWATIDYQEFRVPSRTAPCSCAICKRARFSDVRLGQKTQPDLPRIAHEPDTDIENQA